MLFVQKSLSSAKKEKAQHLLMPQTERNNERAYKRANKK